MNGTKCEAIWTVTNRGVFAADNEGGLNGV